VKREVPLLLTAGIGLFMILSFFVPHHFVSVPADFLQNCAIIVVACGYVLGGANVLRVNLDAISKREAGWGYKIVLVVSLVVTIAIGIIDGIHGHGSFPGEGTHSKWIYDNLYTSMSGTMFALLAFFIASAAFRAFRIRTVEAGMLAVAALIVMLGRVPVGDVMTSWLPAPLQLPTLQQWVMDNPQSSAKRAILIGAALGVMATGLRVILGIERSYLSGED
jgi:hypothetical protein